MVRQSLSRRRFGAALTAAVTVGLAGCSDDDTADEETESGQFEPEDPGDLTVTFETEDGDPVSTGIAVTIEHQDEGYTSNYRHEIDDGQLTASLIYEGEYTITVESVDDEFDAVDETVSLGEDDESATVVLEGATPDSAAEGDDE